jgi:kynurenine formamidase
LRLEDVPPEELGAGARLTSSSVLDALRLPRTGELVDLDPGRFHGMPRHPLSPPFQITTYRTPRGIRNESDIEELRPSANPDNTAWNDELVIGTIHCGAHIDALSHVTAGPRDEWYGGASADKDLGDFGPMRGDARVLPPILARGVLLDVPKAKGLAELPPGYEITARDLREAAEAAAIEFEDGDVVLIRTGLMQHWPATLPLQGDHAGIIREAALFLVEEANPVAIGSDTVGLETPEKPDGRMNVVHIELLVRRGIYIMEWLYLEELARREAYISLFITLPLKIQGATGSWIRPVCIL